MSFKIFFLSSPKDGASTTFTFNEPRISLRIIVPRASPSIPSQIIVSGLPLLAIGSSNLIIWLIAEIFLSVIRI